MTDINKTIHFQANGSIIEDYMCEDMISRTVLHTQEEIVSNDAIDMFFGDWLAYFSQLN